MNVDDVLARVEQQEGISWYLQETTSAERTMRRERRISFSNQAETISEETHGGEQHVAHLHLLHNHKDTGENPVTGNSEVILDRHVTADDIDAAVEQAASIHNPPYQIARVNIIPEVPLAVALDNETARMIVEKMYALCQKYDVSVANAEVFCFRENHRLRSSAGLDHSYESTQLMIEVAMTSRDGSSLYHIHVKKARREEDLDLEQSIAHAAQIIHGKRERHTPQEYEGPVILMGSALADFFADDKGNLFTHHAAMEEKYNGDSAMEIGASFVPEIKGDTLTIVSDPFIPYGLASTPFLHYGAVPRKVTIVEESRLAGLFGEVQHATYLRMEQTGLGNIVVHPGTHTVEELRKGAVVIHSFAAYQIEASSGLVSTLIDAGEQPTTRGEFGFKGGYLRTSYQEALRHLTLSSEMQTNNGYRGPLALRIEHARITGKG